MKPSKFMCYNAVEAFSTVKSLGHPLIFIHGKVKSSVNIFFIKPKCFPINFNENFVQMMTDCNSVEIGCPSRRLFLHYSTNTC